MTFGIGRIVLALLSLVAIATGGQGLAKRHHFLMEKRSVSAAGRASYASLGEWESIKGELASAVWWRGGMLVRGAIESRGFLYVFTTSGQVLGFRVNQSSEHPEMEPSLRYQDSWWWTGEPHAFPFSERRD